MRPATDRQPGLGGDWSDECSVIMTISILHPMLNYWVNSESLVPQGISSAALVIGVGASELALKNPSAYGKGHGLEKSCHARTPRQTSTSVGLEGAGVCRLLYWRSCFQLWSERRLLWCDRPPKIPLALQRHRCCRTHREWSQLPKMVIRKLRPAQIAPALP
jgi:hypothetical protein